MIKVLRQFTTGNSLITSRYREDLQMYEKIRQSDCETDKPILILVDLKKIRALMLQFGPGVPLIPDGAE